MNLLTVFFKMCRYLKVKAKAKDESLPNQIILLKDKFSDDFNITPIYNFSWFTDPLCILYTINKMFMKLKMYPTGTYLYRVGEKMNVGTEKDMMNMRIFDYTRNKPLFCEVKWEDIKGNIYNKDITDYAIEYTNCLGKFTANEFIRIIEEVQGKISPGDHWHMKSMCIIRSNDLEEFIFKNSDIVDLQ